MAVGMVALVNAIQHCAKQVGVDLVERGYCVLGCLALSFPARMTSKTPSATPAITAESDTRVMGGLLTMMTSHTVLSSRTDPAYGATQAILTG